jgi:hypothetical protein
MLQRMIMAVVVVDTSGQERLTGRTVAGGQVRLADLLDTLPVALLVRIPDAG